VGVALTTHFGGVLLEQTNHGDKVVYIKIVGYCVCAYIGITTWWEYVHKIAGMFGVFL
jgi:hypothetical protein